MAILLSILLTASHADSVMQKRTPSYESVIRYIDSMYSTDPQGLGNRRMREVEHRHLREQTPAPEFDIRPTYYDSPFVKPHGQA